VKNSFNLSSLFVSRQPLSGHDHPPTGGANLAPNIKPPTLSGVQWLDANNVSVVRPKAATTAAGDGSAAYGTLSGDETGISLPAEKAAIGDISLDGGGANQLIFSNSAAPGNAIEHVDSGGNGAGVDPPGGDGVDAALTQEDGFDVEERGAVDHAAHLEECILLLYILLFNGYDFKRSIIWCSVSLFLRKKLLNLCAVSLSKGILNGP
jgi:hypothetical protein